MSGGRQTVQPFGWEIRKVGFIMNEMITINYDNPQRPVVSGRELHTALQIETRYNDWFKRMCEYGFSEPNDFYSFFE